MRTQEVDLNGRSQINTQMKEETIGLEEVVAIGYGTVKKQDLTGSVASVGGQALSKRKAVRVAQALQGQVAGVTVTRSSGGPGDDATIRVRGITTIGTSDPLYIIDGIQGDLGMVNPNEIESISVLKDAASASIYGSRASAGVILVTTKRGIVGRNEISYEFETGYDKPTRIPRFARAVPYMKMVNELRWNDANNTGTEYATYAEDLIMNYPALHTENPDKYPDTDYAIYMNDYAPRQTHRLNISSGKEGLKTNVSLAYDKLNSLTDGRALERITARVNNDLTISKMITAHFDMHYYNAHDEREAGGTVSADRLRDEPVGIAFYSDGRVADFRNGDSRWATLLAIGATDAWSGKIDGKASLDFKPLKGFKFTGVIAPSFSNYKQKRFVKQTVMTALDDPSLVTGYVDGGETTKLTETRTDARTLTVQVLANYEKTINGHSFSLMGGFENYYTYDESLGASRDQYILTNFPYLDLGPLDFRDNSGSATEYASRSFFGRLMYNYKNKYLLQSNARYDASSRFAKEYRWGLFPSVSAGWVLTEEPFMGALPDVSFLKLRASYGSLGNERIGSLYPYQSTMGFVNTTLLYQGTNIVAGQAAFINKYPIRDISWETTTSFDVGFDAYFFDNKLQVTADYYNKQTKGMLLDVEVPDYMGLSDPTQNAGKMKTNGWELTIGYSNKIGELNYSVSWNISDYKSVMGDLKGTEFLDSQVKMERSEFNEWYGYKSAGIYQTQDEVDNSAKTAKTVKPGDIKYVDISGPDGVPDGSITSTYDRVLLGGSLPRYEYGGNIRLAYKGFDCLIVFQGVGKIKKYKEDVMIHPLNGGVLGVPSQIPGNYWSKYNTDEQNLSALYPRLSQTGVSNNYAVSDYWLFNGAYFRLKNIDLGYTIPGYIVDKLHLDNVRIYVNMSDLFSIDKFPKGYDPESTASGYFINKSCIMGITVKF